MDSQKRYVEPKDGKHKTEEFLENFILFAPKTVYLTKVLP